jgi:hypothetical protein
MNILQTIGFFISLILIVVLSLALGLALAYLLANYLTGLLWIACSFLVFAAMAVILSKDKNLKT